MFIGLLSVCSVVSFSGSLQSSYKEPLKCISSTNWPWKVRPILVDINSNENLFYPFTVSVKKCGRSCITIDDPYARSK